MGDGHGLRNYNQASKIWNFLDVVLRVIINDSRVINAKGIPSDFLLFNFVFLPTFYVRIKDRYKKSGKQNKIFVRLLYFYSILFKKYMCKTEIR